MSSKTLSLLLVLPWVTLGCQLPESTTASAAVSYWDDVPVPQGFEPVRTQPAEASLQVGEFRHGDYRYQGIGTADQVWHYFAERLPLHGWEAGPGQGAWAKGPSRLQISVTTSTEKTSDGFHKVFIDLRMRSQR